MNDRRPLDGSQEFYRRIDGILEEAAGPRPVSASQPEIVHFLETLLEIAKAGNLPEIAGFARIGNGDQHFFLVDDLSTMPERLLSLCATVYCYPRSPCHHPAADNPDTPPADPEP